MIWNFELVSLVITGLNNLLLLILNIKFKLLLLLISRELFNIYLFIYLWF